MPQSCPPTPAPGTRPAQAGFTLLETLVALALCALLLLTGLALRGTELRARRALAAHETAERALSRAYEEIRGGVVPLAPGVILPSPLTDVGGTLRLEVEPQPEPTLLHIRLVADYFAGGVPAQRTLEALVYAP